MYIKHKNKKVKLISFDILRGKKENGYWYMIDGKLPKSSIKKIISEKKAKNIAKSTNKKIKKYKSNSYKNVSNKISLSEKRKSIRKKRELMEIKINKFFNIIQ